MSFPPATERQARVIWLAVTGLSIALLAALAVGLVWGLGRILQILGPVLWPIAVAGVLAYLLDPLVDYLERHPDDFRLRHVVASVHLASGNSMQARLELSPDLRARYRVPPTSGHAERVRAGQARCHRRL